VAHQRTRHRTPRRRAERHFVSRPRLCNEKRSEQRAGRGNNTHGQGDSSAYAAPPTSSGAPCRRMVPQHSIDASKEEQLALTVPARADVG
jgi:hypothetical protein